MSQAADGGHFAKETLLNEFEDFGQSALHTALESPVNGCIQLIDHAANVHLPELNIIGAPKQNSAGAMAGAAVGAAVDIIGISIATGGVADILGGAGLVGGIATAAATGAIYGGILTPTDNNSKHFVEDRLKNGAVGAIAFATMNGAAQALGASGLFALPAVRSLAGSIGFGALTGAAGGVASAEATAVIKEGKAVPSAGELLSNVGTAAIFGGTLGGLGYALNQVSGPASRATVTTSTEGRSVTTVNDANGQPISFRTEGPSLSEPDDTNVIFRGTKMTNGTWKSAASAVWQDGGGSAGEAYVPKVTSVTAGSDGTVTINSAEGDVRTFTPGAPYGRANPTAEADSAARATAQDLAWRYFDRPTHDGGHEVSTPENGYTRYSAKGDTTEIADAAYSSNKATMSTGSDGALNNVQLLGHEGQPHVSLEATGNGSWTFHTGEDVYKWQGDVQQIKDPGTGNVTGLKFIPKSGAPAIFDMHSGTQNVTDSLLATSQFESLAKGLGYADTNSKGDLVIKGGTGLRIFVNGQETADPTTIKTGDVVKVSLDVGDRYAIWEDQFLNLSTNADGKPMVNGQVIPGGKPINLQTVLKSTTF